MSPLQGYIGLLFCNFYIAIKIIIIVIFHHIGNLFNIVSILVNT